MTAKLRSIESKPCYQRLRRSILKRRWRKCAAMSREFWSLAGVEAVSSTNSRATDLAPAICHVIRAMARLSDVARLIAEMDPAARAGSKVSSSPFRACEQGHGIVGRREEVSDSIVDLTAMIRCRSAPTMMDAAQSRASLTGLHFNGNVDRGVANDQGPIQSIALAPHRRHPCDPKFVA
jgi:hypothetical protein